MLDSKEFGKSLGSVVAGDREERDRESAFELEPSDGSSDRGKGVGVGRSVRVGLGARQTIRAQLRVKTEIPRHLDASNQSTGVREKVKAAAAETAGDLPRSC